LANKERASMVSLTDYEEEFIMTEDDLINASSEQDITADQDDLRATDQLIRGLTNLSMYARAPARNDFVKPTLSSDFRIHTKQQADKILYGGLYHNPITGALEDYVGLYTRVYEPATNTMRHGRATYCFKSELYQGPDTASARVDIHNAAVITERLQFEDMLLLLQAMYEHEQMKEETIIKPTVTDVEVSGLDLHTLITTAPRLRSVFIRVSIDGVPMPKPIYISAARFREHTTLKATGRSVEQVAEDLIRARDNQEEQTHPATTATVLPQFLSVQLTKPSPYVAAVMMPILNELVAEEEHGYDFQAHHSSVGTPKLIPTGFGVIYQNQHDMLGVPTRFTPVLGLTAEQEEMIKKLLTHPDMRPKGTILRDYDRRMGYCLFDTMAALTNFDPDLLIEECGHPDPYTVTAETYATKAANIVQSNFIIYQLVSTKDHKVSHAKAVFITNTSYAKTNNILMLTLTIKNALATAERQYKHAVHIIFEDEEAVVTPFEGPTVFIGYDTETTYNTEAQNKTYALSTITYRVAPIPVTMETYDPETQKKILQVLDTSSFEKTAEPGERPVWVPVYGEHGEMSGKELIKYVTVSYEYTGNAIKSVIAYIMYIKQLLAPYTPLHIVFTGFNIARFDNFYLLGALTDYFNGHGGVITPFIQTNKIASISVVCQSLKLTISTFDVRCHVVGSLATCCEAWMVPTDLTKKQLDHSVVQMCYNMEPNKFNEFIEANKVVIDEYCRYDVVACMLLHVIYKTSMESIYNDAFVDRYGISLGMLSLFAKVHDLTEGDKKKRTKCKLQLEHTTGKSLGYIRNDAHFYEVLSLVLSKLPLPASLVDLIILLKALQQRGFTVPTPPINPSMCEITRPLIPKSLIHKFMPDLIEASTNDNRIELPSLSMEQGQLLLSRTVEAIRNRLGYRLLASIGSHNTVRPTEDIEQYSTLASYATHIHNILVNSRGWNQVGGFRVEAAQFLKTYLRIAGRSQTTFGIHEEDVYMMLDVTSLYPTAMSCPDTAYAIGEDNSMDPLRGFDIVGEQVDTYQLPVNGVIKPAIYKVKVNTLPKEVLITLMDGRQFTLNYETMKPGWLTLSAHELDVFNTISIKTTVKVGRLLIGVDSAIYESIIKRAHQFNTNEPSDIKVACRYIKEYQPRIDGIIQPAIYKVLIHKQPNGIVIPARDKEGYHWDHDHYKESYALVTSQDIESLQLTGADFTIIDGVLFTHSTTQLYTDFIGIAGSEKSRQDRLRKDTTVAKFNGERYSPGKREASKLALNILSGKQVMKIYTQNTNIYSTSAEPITQDSINETKQNACLAIANGFLKDKTGKVKVFKPDTYNKWAEKNAKANSIPRMVGEPYCINNNTWLATWDHIPQQASANDIDGDIIYARSRLYMNTIYSTIGFNNILLSETDSVLIGAQHVSKLYSLSNPYGAPMIYANIERSLGLLPEAPPCASAKQFGQLELESTELLIKTITKYMKKQEGRPSTYTITSLTYEGHELIVNGVHTGLRGLYMASAGKKIYVLYLRDRNNNIIKAKARFKGVTFKRDWVIDSRGMEEHPELYLTLTSMTPHNRLVYIANELECVKHESVHKMSYKDIFDLIKYHKLYIIQTRVAAADMAKMLTIQDAIIKVISVPASPETITERQARDIRIRSNMIKQYKLKRLANIITYGKQHKHKECDSCAKDGEFVLDYRLLCQDHINEPSTNTVCMALNHTGKSFCCSEVEPGETLCKVHKQLAHRSIELRHCSYTCDGSICKGLVSPTAVKNGIHRCKEHYSDLLSYKFVPCLMLVEGRQCLKPSCSKAINNKLRLCRIHYKQNRYRVEREGAISSKQVYQLLTNKPEQVIHDAATYEQWCRVKEATDEQNYEAGEQVCIHRTAALSDVKGCLGIRFKKVKAADDKVKPVLCGKLLEDDDLARGFIYCSRHRHQVPQMNEVILIEPSEQLQIGTSEKGQIKTIEVNEINPIQAIESMEETTCTKQTNTLTTVINTKRSQEDMISLSEQPKESVVSVSSVPNAELSQVKAKVINIESKVVSMTPAIGIKMCQAKLKTGIRRGQVCGKAASCKVNDEDRCGLHRR
jgi:hypothetical protein